MTAFSDTRVQPAARPPRHILIATIAALLAAVVILMTVVLPAEYGVDPLGTGRALGLSALADVNPGVVVVQQAPFNTDTIQFELRPFESVEYKYRLQEGASMLYSWKATGEVAIDLHSEPDGAPEGYAESFESRNSSGSSGTYTAPFSGIHGWFWENRGRETVVVTLTTAGFYSGAQEFRDGGIFEHEVSAVLSPESASVP